MERYSPEKYPKYDNYDAIEVSKTLDIPMDYDGVMGVPISFLDKYCPEQFEIVAIGQGDDMRKFGVSAQFVDDYKKSGQTGCVSVGHPFLVYYDNDHYPTIPYRRILIRRKNK